jgi:hypothetical protein
MARRAAHDPDPPVDTAFGAAGIGGAEITSYFAACALSASMSSWVRNVITNIWCER